MKMKWLLSMALFLLASLAVGADSKPESITKTGKLSANSGDDKTIVAILHVEEADGAAPAKGKKKNKNAPPSNSINLIATGDIATKLADYITKNTFVAVTGKLADGKMTVTEVKEVPDPSSKKKKK